MGEGKLYGNALVSKYPIIDSEVFIIPDPVERKGNKHYETRSVIKAIIDVGGSNVTVITSHFGLNLDERLNAAHLVLSLVKECNTPVVFMGDLNTTPDDPVYALLADEMTDAAAALHADDTTFPSDDPKIRIDYIFVKNAYPSECHSVRKVVSDHFALTALIEFD